MKQTDEDILRDAQKKGIAPGYDTAYLAGVYKARLNILIDEIEWTIEKDPEHLAERIRKVYRDW